MKEVDEEVVIEVDGLPVAVDRIDYEHDPERVIARVRLNRQNVRLGANPVTADWILHNG